MYLGVGVYLDSSGLELSGLPESECLFPKVTGVFSHYFCKYIFCSFFSLSSPPGALIMWIAISLMVSHGSFKLSPLFFALFLFLILCLDESHCPVFELTGLFSCSVLSAVVPPLLYFSVKLYSSAPWLVFGSLMLSFFVEVLTVCIHFPPSLVSIFMTIILNSLSGQSFTFISLRTFSEVYSLFFHLEHFPLFFHFPWLFVLVSMHKIKQPLFSFLKE